LASRVSSAPRAATLRRFVPTFFLKASRFERLRSIGGYFLWWKLFSGKTVIRGCGQVDSSFIVLGYLIYGQPSADFFN
jgi:hypothetical protein